MSTAAQAEPPTPEEVRRRIAARYTEAGTRAAEATRHTGPATQGPLDLAHLDLSDEQGPIILLDELAPGRLAEIAGYAEDEAASLPAGALKGSFACARPLRFARLKPGQTVLDLGCGQGVDVILAGRAVGPTGRVVGVDLTPVQVDQARRHITEAGLANADIRQGPMEALPVESETVDWVISNAAINYSPEKPKVFAEAFRVLRPGGELLVTDLLTEDLDPVLSQRLLGYVHDRDSAASQVAYLGLMRDAGFADVEVLEHTVYSTEQLLTFAGYDEDAVGKADAALRQLMHMLDGKLGVSAIHARKPG